MVKTAYNSGIIVMKLPGLPATRMMAAGRKVSYWLECVAAPRKGMRAILFTSTLSIVVLGYNEF
jgi:hypothetical protein